MSLKCFLYAWQPDAKISACCKLKVFKLQPLVPAPRRKDLIVGSLSDPHLSCTLLGASSRQFMCLSTRGSLAAMRIPEEERKKRTVIKQAPKGGLQPPGTMENGAYVGSRGSRQGLLSWRGTDDSCDPPQLLGRLVLRD